MKTKKFLLPAVFLVFTIILYVIATVLFCYTTKPEVSEGEFPFSITYEYKGETKTLSGVFKCSFSGSSTIQGEHTRHWEGVTEYDNPEGVGNPYIIEQNDELMTTLAVQENMYAGYFMGDPLHEDHYRRYEFEGAMPQVEYYDYKNDIYPDTENYDEALESIGFRIVDFTYPEPIENSFSISGVRYEADNVIIFIAVSLIFLILCLIFVRKEKDLEYSNFDKCGIILNFVVGIVSLPFISFTCILFGLVESNFEIINQITYSIPPIAVICLALSIVFRRKGLSKTGFYIQFTGIALFILMVIADLI